MIGSSIRDGVETKILNSVKVGGQHQSEQMNTQYNTQYYDPTERASPKAIHLDLTQRNQKGSHFQLNFSAVSAKQKLLSTRKERTTVNSTAALKESMSIPATQVYQDASFANQAGHLSHQKDKLRKQNKKLSSDFKQLAIRSKESIKESISTYETYCGEVPFCSRKALQSVNDTQMIRNESKQVLNMSS